MVSNDNRTVYTARWVSYYKTDELCNEVKNQPTIETETLFSRLKSEVKSPTPAGL